VADAQHRTAENLTAEVFRVNHRPHVGDGQIVEDVVLPGFDVDFDLGEPGNE